MDHLESNFLKALTKKPVERIPLYCTGYPEIEFMKKFIKQYTLKSDNNTNLLLMDKDYSLIKQMGFDAVSIWDFRRGEGGYMLKDDLRVDGWGRIYKENWYMWDGLIKDQHTLENWEYLNLPTEKDFLKLENFLTYIKDVMEPVLSLPGLFEKSWQSMGYLHFAKSLRKNIGFIEDIISYFTDYVKRLIRKLQKAGAEIFLIADDCAYKKRTFLSNELWQKLFFKSYREIIDFIHKDNHKVIIHSDGNISSMIDIFIDLKFDAVQSLEPNSGIDIFSLFKSYSNNICFIGNLDVSTLLSFGTPFQVKSYTEKLIKKAKKFNISLIISPTQQLITSVKPENIRSMIETTINFKYVIEE
jgi:uroporphyrinogen-III decarboxylase